MQDDFVDKADPVGRASGLLGWMGLTPKDKAGLRSSLFISSHFSSAPTAASGSSPRRVESLAVGLQELMETTPGIATGRVRQADVTLALDPIAAAFATAATNQQMSGKVQLLRVQPRYPPR